MPHKKKHHNHWQTDRIRRSQVIVLVLLLLLLPQAQRHANIAYPLYVTAESAASARALRACVARMADPIIDGTHSSAALLHQSLVDAAGAYLERLHLAPCTDETPILFYRMDFHGIGNDLTRATAALATAVINRRQLVLLPPLRRLHAKVPSLQRTSWQRPWHWLVRGPTGLGLASSQACSSLHVLRSMCSGQCAGP